MKVSQRRKQKGKEKVEIHIINRLYYGSRKAKIMRKQKRNSNCTGRESNPELFLAL